jgi:predicted aspartyl protease
MFAAAERALAIVTVAILACATVPAQTTAHSAPLDVIHGKPYVMVTVNGKGPFRFVVDTGTGGEAFVTPQLAAQLSLPPAGQARLHDPSGQGGQRVPMVRIQSLEVAGVEFKGVKAAVHDLSEADGSCQGLLGFVLFRNSLLTLDFPGRRMTLESGAVEPDGERSVFKFRMPESVPIVPMLIDGIKFDAEIDSGGSGLSLPEPLVSHLKFAAGPFDFSNGQSFSTRFQIKSARLESDVHLGSYTFTQPFVEINPAFPLANFGSCPLKDFAVTFDQHNLLVRFDGRSKLLHLAATPSPFHLKFVPKDKPPDRSLVPAG